MRVEVDRWPRKTPIKNVFVNTDATPEWLTDDALASFMADVDAPAAVLA